MKQTKYKVSIIIPCYNSKKYIERCLNSILKDKLKEKEIILINDGSTDNTLEIIEEYSKKNKDIKIINQKNKGQSISRNNGLKEAKGKYIAFVDSDDWVEEDYFYKLYNCAEKNKSDYIYCDYYEDKQVYKSNKYNNDIEKVKIIENTAPWAKLILKELIDKTKFKFPNIRMYEDTSSIPILALNSKNAYYLEEGLYHYNKERKKEYNEKVLDVLEAENILYEYFKNNNLINEYYEELKYIFVVALLKHSVLELAKYKEGLKYINQVRKSIKPKFKKLLFSKYYKYDSFYSRILMFISLYFPKRIIYILRKTKGDNK